MASDHFLPRQFNDLGDRLVLVNGIPVLPVIFAVCGDTPPPHELLGADPSRALHEPAHTRQVVIVPLSEVDRATAQTLDYVRSLPNDITAVYIAFDGKKARQIAER